MRAAVLLALAVVAVTCVSASLGEAPYTERLAKIDLNLRHQIARVVKEKGWTQQHAERVAVEYRKFWLLHVRYPEQRLVPSLDVDELWHAHILFTEQYATDCDRIFGGFLHHYPTVEEDEVMEPERAEQKPADLLMPGDEKVSDYEAMLALYEREFGYAAGPVWISRDAASCCSGKCGSNSTATATGADKKAAGCGTACGSKNASAAGCGNCGSKLKAATPAGCGSACGSKGKTNAMAPAGCGNCGSKCPFKAAKKAAAEAAGCGNCHGGVKKSVGKVAGCGNCHGKVQGEKQAAGCGNCHGKVSNNAGAGCGNCHGKVTNSETDKAAAGCGNCHGKVKSAKQAAGCGNCHGKIKAGEKNAAGCGNCHGAVKKAAGCGNCHGKVKGTKGENNAAGCGNCHGQVKGQKKEAAGCGNCHGKVKGQKEAAGCGNCHGKVKSGSEKQAAGCGNCHGAVKKADAAVQTDAADAPKPVVHLRP